jgi:hypothetical protein
MEENKMKDTLKNVSFQSTNGKKLSLLDDAI